MAWPLLQFAELHPVARFHAPRRPWLKGLMLLIPAYLISPIDLIPDFIPVVGWLDDAIVIPLMVSWIVRMLPQRAPCAPPAATAPRSSTATTGGSDPCCQFLAVRSALASSHRTEEAPHDQILDRRRVRRACPPRQGRLHAGQSRQGRAAEAHPPPATASPTTRRPSPSAARTSCRPSP